MTTVLPLLTKRDDLVDKLFGERPGGVRLYDLRNDIAHGNRCDHELAFTDLVDEQIYELHKLGKEILQAVIYGYDEVALLIYNDTVLDGAGV
jgi:hypothetical protein